MPDTLVAGDIRERVNRALLPLIVAAMDGLAPRLRGTVKELVRVGRAHLGAIVQVHPPVLRVLLLGGERAVELERVTGNLGPELQLAAEDAVAGMLSGMPEPDREAAIAYAAQARNGGFFVFADSSAGSVTAALAVEGHDMSNAVALGVIADAPSRAH